LHARVHSFLDIHTLRNRDLRKTEHACTGLIEAMNEVDGEFRAGVDAGADAEVDEGVGPGVMGGESQRAAGEGPGCAVGGGCVETAACTDVGSVRAG